jgi:hypothetical protein
MFFAINCIGNIIKRKELLGYKMKKKEVKWVAESERRLIYSK